MKALAVRPEPPSRTRQLVVVTAETDATNVLPARAVCGALNGGGTGAIAHVADPVDE